MQDAARRAGGHALHAPAVQHRRRVAIGQPQRHAFAGLHFPGKLQQRRFQWAVAVILALYMAGAAIAMSRPALGPLAVPIILMALLKTVLFKGRIGYTTTLLAVTILAVLPEVKAGHVFAWYVLGMVTVMSVRRVYKRSLFYRTILLLTFLSVTLIFLLELGRKR